MICSICKSERVNVSMKEQENQLMNCKNCGLVFFHPQPTEEELSQFYNSSYNLTAYFSPITRNRYEELLDEFDIYRNQNVILDIGCGYGFFLEVALEKKWKVLGTEISAKTFDVLARKNIELTKTLESLPDESVDVVVLIETIEHIKDPKGTIQDVHRVLRSGGIVYITTPNFNSLNRRRYGAKYDVISYPLHLFYFTKRSLNKLLVLHNFEKLSLKSSGISRTRIMTSKGKSNQEYVAETSDDEMLRYRIEKSGSLRLFKRITNWFLNLTGLGESLKATYIKR